MYKSRLLPLPVLILSALNAYAANTPNPLDQIDKNVPNQFDKDFRDNLDQIHSVEIQKREQSAWDLQKKQDNDAVTQEMPSENRKFSDGIFIINAKRHTISVMIMPR